MDQPRLKFYIAGRGTHPYCNSQSQPSMEPCMAGGETIHGLLLLWLHSSEVSHCNFIPVEAVVCMLAIVIVVNFLTLTQTHIVNTQI